MKTLGVIRGRGVVIDLDEGVVRRDGGESPLTPLEVRVLLHLAEAEEPVSAQELLVSVWGYAPRTRSRAARVAVSRLRQKIEPDPRAPSILVTIGRAGYALVSTPVGRSHLEAEVDEVLAALYATDAQRAMARVGAVRDDWLTLASSQPPALRARMLEACGVHAQRTDLGVSPAALLDAMGDARPPHRLVVVAGRLLQLSGASGAAERLLLDYRAQWSSQEASAGDLEVEASLLAVWSAQGRFADVERRARECIERAELLSEPVLAARFVERVGAVLSRRGDGSAEHWFLEAAHVFDHAETLHYAATTRHNLGIFYLRDGRLDAAKRAFDRSHACFATLGDARALTSVCLAQATVRICTDPPEAVRTLTTLHRDLEGAEDRRTWCTVELALGTAYIGVDAVDAAEACFRRAAHLARRSSLSGYAGTAARWLGWLAHWRGDPGAACALYDEALASLAEGRQRAFCIVWRALARGEVPDLEALVAYGVDPAWIAHPDRCPPLLCRVEVAATARLAKRGVGRL